MKHYLTSLVIFGIGLVSASQQIGLRAEKAVVHNSDHVVITMPPDWKIPLRLRRMTFAVGCVLSADLRGQQSTQDASRLKRADSNAHTIK